MADIKMNVVIKTTPDKVYEAVTTQEGIQAWWCKNSIVKPEVGFVNTFTFGKYHNEFKVTELSTNKKVAWLGTKSIDEWVDTTVSFELEEKNGNTLLRFTHAGYKEANDTYAGCTYDWASFIRSLKSLCETGTGTPA